MTERRYPAQSLSKSPIVFSREADGVLRNSEGVAYIAYRDQADALERSKVKILQSEGVLASPKK